MKKLKNVKHIEIIICIIFIALLLLIYFYGFNTKQTSTKDHISNLTDINSATYVYEKELEQRLSAEGKKTI